MPQISWRHHYIPEFYLNNFTNTENKFHIYLVKEDRYKDNGNLFSPRTHYFEEDGNTIFNEQMSFDFIETDHYKIIDSRVSNLFQKVKFSNKKRHGLTESDMPMFEFFAAHLFWRNPMNDGFIKELINRKGLSGLGLQIKNKTTNEIKLDSATEKNLLANESFYKIIKYLIPTMEFPKLLENTCPLYICVFNPNDLPSLVCDNPLILRNPEQKNVYTDDFILPLCNDKILIRTKRKKSLYESTVRVLVDLVLLMQANKFVSTTDVDYIQSLKKMADNRPLEYWRNELFSSIVDE
jgi:hypothetical protein